MSGSRGKTAVDERVLRVYVAEHCGTCRESRRLARVIAERLTDVMVDVVDVDDQEPVDEIFALPTFCYRGKIIALGNPREDELIMRVLSLERETEHAVIADFGSQEQAPLVTGLDSRSRGANSASPVSMTAGRGGPLTACFGALGIAGAILCSLSMIAPIVGLIAAQGLRSSGGMSGSATGHTQVPSWWEILLRLGPEVLITSVLLVVLTLAFRRPVAMVPAIIGGLILYLGMYDQPSSTVMYATTAVGIVSLLLAFLAGLRPTLSLAQVRLHR